MAMTDQPRPQYIPRHDPGDVEFWRADLLHTEQLTRAVFEREPAPHDGADLLRDQLRRAAIASLLPDGEAALFEAITSGAGAAGAAVLTQRRWWTGDRDGRITLAWPDQPERDILVGDTGISYPEWINGFALAVLARDQDALTILCTGDSIDACALPPDLIDAFWPSLCGALASLLVEPSATGMLLEKAEAALQSFAIAEPALIERRIRPLLGVIRAVGGGDSPVLNGELAGALHGHREYFIQPNRQDDWSGFLAVWPAALGALAVDRGMRVEVRSGYAPEALTRGEFPRRLCSVLYTYPPRSIGLAEEAQWFLDLEGFPRAGRAHTLVERDGRLVARYEAHGAPGCPHALVEFALVEPDELGRAAGAGPPLALNVGDLLLIAAALAGSEGDGGGIEAGGQHRRMLMEAVAAVDAALARIPPEQEAITAETITSWRGRALYEAEPGRFRRDRMTAYRDALREALDGIDVEPRDAPTHTDEPQLPAGAQAAAYAAVELIRAQVTPLLEALAHDRSGEVAASLKPRPEDYARVFVSEAVAASRRGYEALWEVPAEMAYPSAGQTALLCSVAPAGMLAEENELSRQFPGGYRSVARWLNPHRVWVRWKYVRPGETSGLAYDGLVWCDDHWAWFPKPFRVLAALHG